jgi:uncharacterized protein (UPF0335 family)
MSLLALKSYCEKYRLVRKKMAEAGGIAGEKLRSYIERIERLEAEKSALAADIREIFADAKGNGFDAKIMRQIVRLRKMDHQDRAEQEELLILYQHAIGME